MAAAPVQWEVSDGGNGHYYDIITLNSSLTFDAAKAAAEVAHGYLVTITSAGENNWIHDVLAGGGDDGFSALDGHYIGAYQLSKVDEPAGNWAWVTGEAWSLILTNWFPPDEPTNTGGAEDYAVFAHDWSTDNGVYWNDSTGLTERGYVIEYDQDPTQAPVPEPATLVLFSVGLAGLASCRRKKMVKK